MTVTVYKDPSIIENTGVFTYLESSILALFDKPSFIVFTNYTIISFEYVAFWQKILLFRSPKLEPNIGEIP